MLNQLGKLFHSHIFGLCRNLIQMQRLYTEKEI